MAGRVGAALPAAPRLPRLRRQAFWELMLVGGATPVLLALSWLVRQRFALEPVELSVGFTMFWAAHVINDPHFTVSYVLFYRRARARALGDELPRGLRVRYWFAGLVAPAALAAWIAWALRTDDPGVLGALLQSMFAMVGFHYVKQGFGAAMVLSARRGARFTLGERRALLAHCLSAWAFAWADPAVPARDVMVKGVVYLAWPRPAWFRELSLWLFLATGTWAATQLWRACSREGYARLLTPITALLASTWAWSVWAHADPLVRYVVPALHGVQYLYFVWLVERNEGREQEAEPHFGPPVRTRLVRVFATALVLGWLLFDGLPELLDGTRDVDGALGASVWVASFYAFVNIHHFVMDGVLWRRELPATRHLLG